MTLSQLMTISLDPIRRAARLAWLKFVLHHKASDIAAMRKQIHNDMKALAILERQSAVIHSEIGGLQ